MGSASLLDVASLGAGIRSRIFAMTSISNVDHTALPDEKTVSKSSGLNVYDDCGNEVTFSSLFQDKKTIVIFIRFLASVRSEALEEAGTRIIIIGCGDWRLIKNYCVPIYVADRLTIDAPLPALGRSIDIAEQIISYGDDTLGWSDWRWRHTSAKTTGFKGALYADPSRALYDTFGLVENLERTPVGQEKRSYVRSFLGNVVKSIWDGPLKNPQYIGKQRNISQLGGDFIFGPGQKCTYASRMRHTEDHVEVANLMREAAVPYP
ncbi:Thioredoxin-like protein AAED1 [Grifola frondosa]|uniref:Thioredoxin-like protein AAED1 n=1 Tax=Grifola frondosa TaxID=5627 RepID=A0A1C7LV89_GRIFR|nr:Thioredoxin-like protein AAED1 [Grifola frondosa]